MTIETDITLDRFLSEDDVFVARDRITCRHTLSRVPSEGWIGCLFEAILSSRPIRVEDSHAEDFQLEYKGRGRRRKAKLSFSVPIHSSNHNALMEQVEKVVQKANGLAAVKNDQP